METESKRIYTAADLAAAIISIALGYIYIKFVLFNPVSLYIMLFNFAFGTLAIFYVKSSGRKIKQGHIVVIAAAFLLNCVYIISSNTFINFIGGTFGVMLGIYIFFISANGFGAFGNSFLADLSRSVFSPFSAFGECMRVIVSNIKKKKQGRKIGYIFIGLIISLPVTFICAGLLMSADDVFKNVMSRIVHFGLDEIIDFIIRFSFGIPVASYLFGMLFTNVKGENSPSAENPFPTHVLPVPVICSAVAPVCLLYAIFFISHFTYLTSALFGSLHTDFSYAEYARQGFFELCAVAFINLIIVIFLNIFDKKNENNATSKAVKFFTLFIISSTIILIITALGKMLLYIDTYGLTRLRVYTSWFMVLLLLVFLVIAIRAFNEKLKVFKPLFAVFAVMIGLLCFGDVDGFIAGHNISAYQSGKFTEFDVSLFYNLSDTAVIRAISLADDEKIGEQIRLYLQHKYDELNNLEFKRYNFESVRALKALQNYYLPQA